VASSTSFLELSASRYCALMPRSADAFRLSMRTCSALVSAAISCDRMSSGETVAFLIFPLIAPSRSGGVVLDCGRVTGVEMGAGRGWVSWCCSRDGLISIGFHAMSLLRRGRWSSQIIANVGAGSRRLGLLARRLRLPRDRASGQISALQSMLLPHVFSRDIPRSDESVSEYFYTTEYVFYYADKK
jgi:hypothetical protein